MTGSNSSPAFSCRVKNNQMKNLSKKMTKKKNKHLGARCWSCSQKKKKNKLKKLAITKDNNETNQSLGGGLLNSSTRQSTLDFGTIIKTGTRSTKWTKYSNLSLFAVIFVLQGVCASEERIRT